MQSFNNFRAVSIGRGIGSGPAWIWRRPDFVAHPADKVRMSVRALESDGIRLQSPDKGQDIRSPLFHCQHATVKPYLEEITIIAPQLGKLLFHTGDIFLLGVRAARLDDSGIVNPIISIGRSTGVNSRLYSEFAAGGDEILHDISFAITPRCILDTVIMGFRRPKAESAAMLGHEHGIFGSDPGSSLKPLVGIKVNRIESRYVRMCSELTPLIIRIEHLHVKMEHDTDLGISPFLLPFIRDNYVLLHASDRGQTDRKNGKQGSFHKRCFDYLILLRCSHISDHFGYPA